MKDLRCMIGLHTGSRSPGAGLSMYTCPRCKGSFWQKRDNHTSIAQAEAAINRNDFEEAFRIKADALGHAYVPPPAKREW